MATRLWPAPKERPDFNDGSWHMLYPIYLDSTRSKSKGRKVSKNVCVDRPGAEDIYEVCRQLKLNAFIEIGKAHPQTSIDRIGRVRVQYGKEQYKSKKSLLNEIGPKIVALPNHEKRKALKKKKEEDLLKSIAGKQPIVNEAKKNKKKGKKRR